jgi:glutaredoxin 3
MNQKIKTWTLNIVLTTVTAALAIVIGSQLPILVKKWQGPFKNGDYTTHVAQLPYKLTLYGTTTCSHCISARAFLKQAGIPFNDQIVDQSKTAETAYKQLNEKAVPILVSETKLIVGFNEDLYSELGKISLKK